MRTLVPFICASMMVLLTGCSPQEQARSPEFYLKPENAAEFAKALEGCKTSGMSHKDKCGPVWQAKFALDRAEEKALVERALAEREGGVSVVQQSPKPAPVAAPVPVRKAPGAESADATGTAASPQSRN